jgi:hypothetical protein
MRETLLIWALWLPVALVALTIRIVSWIVGICPRRVV